MPRIQPKVLEWFLLNPDRPTHYVRIAKDVGFSPTQTVNACIQLVMKHPKLRRIGAGVYEWQTANGENRLGQHPYAPEPEPRPVTPVAPSRPVEPDYPEPQPQPQPPPFQPRREPDPEVGRAGRVHRKKVQHVDVPGVGEAVLCEILSVERVDGQVRVLAKDTETSVLYVWTPFKLG